MNPSDITAYLWLALVVLLVRSGYLIVEGYKVQKLFADSIVGKLVKALVVVFIIELYSLGLVSFAFVFFYAPGVVVLLPIVILWVISLGFAIFAVRNAKKEVSGLMNK
jgi:hypothetical protein